MAIHRAGSGGVRTPSTNGFTSAGATTAVTTGTQTRPLNQTQSSFTSTPANTTRGPNLGQQPVVSQQAATSSSSSSSSQFDFDVNEMRQHFSEMHKNEINKEKGKFKEKDVTVDRSGDSTDRGSKIMLDALLDPAKAAQILREGIPSEGVAAPQPRTAADIAAMEEAERVCAAKEGRPVQPIKPSIHELLTKVASGQKISADEMKAAGNVVGTWAKGNRMVLDGFYSMMLAAAKKEPNRW